MIRFWKLGYPPRPPTIVPELPVLSLGLHQGNQIIVSEAPATVTGADATPSGGTGSSSIPPRAAPSKSATSVPSRSVPTRASVAAPAPIPNPLTVVRTLYKSMELSRSSGACIPTLGVGIEMIVLPSPSRLTPSSRSPPLVRRTSIPVDVVLCCCLHLDDAP